MANTDTRSLRIYAADNIYIHGLTRGPAAGWSFDGTALIHVGGTRIALAEGAATRVADGVKTAIPSAYSEKTGYQLSQMSDEEKVGYEFSHVRDVHGIYVRSTPAQPSTVELDRADVVSMGR